MDGNPFLVLLAEIFNLQGIGTVTDCLEDFVSATTLVDNLDTYNPTWVFLLAYEHTTNIALFYAGTPK